MGSRSKCWNPETEMMAHRWRIDEPRDGLTYAKSKCQRCGRVRKDNLVGSSLDHFAPIYPNEKHVGSERARRMQKSREKGTARGRGTMRRRHQNIKAPRLSPKAGQMRAR